MKKWCVLIVLLLTFVLIREGFTKDVFDKQEIRQEPVNILTYAYDGVDYGLTILAQLLKTGKPTGMWNKENPKGEGGYGITLIEGFLHKNLDLVGGGIVQKDEFRYTFLGIEAKLFLKGKLGKVLSKFRPGVYWSEDEWWFGVSLGLGGMSTQEE